MEVLARRHHEDHATELAESNLLSRPKLVLHEERTDDVVEMLELAHAIGHSGVVIRSNHAHPEVRLQRVEELNIVLVLDDREFRLDLNSVRHAGMRFDPDVKTSFTIREPDDPLGLEIHPSIPNVWSLRVLDIVKSSLRIVPMTVGL